MRSEHLGSAILQMIDAVLVEQVDVAGAESLEATVDRLTDVPGLAVERAGLAVLELTAEFWWGNHRLVAPALQRPADQLLVDERAIDLGGVDKRDAELERAMNRGNGRGVIRRAVGLAHMPMQPSPMAENLKRAEFAVSSCAGCLH